MTRSLQRMLLGNKALLTLLQELVCIQIESIPNRIRCRIWRWKQDSLLREIIFLAQDNPVDRLNSQLTMSKTWIKTPPTTTTIPRANEADKTYRECNTPKWSGTPSKRCNRAKTRRLASSTRRNNHKVIANQISQCKILGHSKLILIKDWMNRDSLIGASLRAPLTKTRAMPKCRGNS